MRRALIAGLFLLLPAGAGADPLGSPNTFPLLRDNPPLRHHDDGGTQTREKSPDLNCVNLARSPDDRIVACRALIDANKRTPNTWSALGGAYLDKDDWTAAIDALTHAINDDDIWLARADRAIAYVRAGNYAAALADADEFIKINRGGNAQSLALRCRVRAIADKEREAALADCDAALAREPHLANPLNDKALLLFRIGRTSEALTAAIDATRFGGHLPLALYLQGIIKKQNGDASADADITAALGRDPRVAEQLTSYRPGRGKPQASDEEPPP